MKYFFIFCLLFFSHNAAISEEKSSMTVEINNRIKITIEEYSCEEDGTSKKNNVKVTTIKPSNSEENIIFDFWNIVATIFGSGAIGGLGYTALKINGIKNIIDKEIKGGKRN